MQIFFVNVIAPSSANRLFVLLLLLYNLHQSALGVLRIHLHKHTHTVDRAHTHAHIQTRALLNLNSHKATVIMATARLFFFAARSASASPPTAPPPPPPAAPQPSSTPTSSSSLPSIPAATATLAQTHRHSQRTKLRYTIYNLHCFLLYLQRPNSRLLNMH